MEAEAAGTGDLTPSFLAIFADLLFSLALFLNPWLHNTTKKF